MKKAINFTNSRSITVLTVFAVAVAAIILACMSVGGGGPAEVAYVAQAAHSAQEAEGVSAFTRERISVSGEHYVLKEYHGDICVFTSDSGTEPSIVTNIDVSTLRQTDADALKEGLTVDSFEKLLMLLEDFGS